MSCVRGALYGSGPHIYCIDLCEVERGIQVDNNREKQVGVYNKRLYHNYVSFQEIIERSRVYFSEHVTGD